MEKRELELFRQGQFVIEDEEKEDANASADRPIPPDITAEVNTFLVLLDHIFVVQNTTSRPLHQMFLRVKRQMYQYLHRIPGLLQMFIHC